jgi:CelD/BcsL family acetyltransferase involved in cellulose biosynthesis
VSSPELIVEVHEELGAHRAAWDALAAAQPHPSPFLRSWWLGHTATGTPRFVLCFSGGELVGGAAFERDERQVGPWTLERIRCVGQGPLAPDHLDLIATPEHHLAVARAVLAWLRRPGARIVELDGLAADGTLARVLAGHEVERSPAPYARLTPGAVEYLAARPGALRSTIKRAGNRFAKQGATFVRVDPTGAAAALERLSELHDGRWGEGSVFLRRWERVRDAALDGIASGDVVLFELRDADGVAVASELDLRAGSTVSFYQAGRRTEREWRGCGSVLRARIIEAVAADGVDEYDLLRGDESYKADWATDRRELVRVRLTVGALAVVSARMLDRRAARLAAQASAA